MTTYQIKLFSLFSDLKNLTVSERVDYCSKIGLHYPWVRNEIQSEIFLKLD